MLILFIEGTVDGDGQAPLVLLFDVIYGAIAYGAILLVDKLIRAVLK